MERRLLDEYATAMAVSLAVPIPAQYREAVIDNLATLFAQADGLMALDLAPEEEAAPVFTP